MNILDKPFKVPVYILAGGKSSRFGSDKANFLYRGKTLLSLVAKSLKSVASHMVVVAGEKDKYQEQGFVTIPDLQPGKGPLAGIFAACHHADQQLQASWILVTSCDLVGLDPAWIEDLLVARSPAYQAIVFKDVEAEPFPALYETGIKEIAEQLINTDQLVIRKLLDNAKTKHLPIPVNWNTAVNVNHIKDLGEE